MEAKILDTNVSSANLDYLLLKIERNLVYCYDNLNSGPNRVEIPKDKQKTKLTILERDYIRLCVPIEIKYPLMTQRGIPSFLSPMKLKDFYTGLAFDLGTYLICIHHDLFPHKHFEDICVYENPRTSTSFGMPVLSENPIASVCYRALIEKILITYGHYHVGVTAESFRNLVKNYVLKRLEKSGNVKTLVGQRNLYLMFLEALYFTKINDFFSDEVFEVFLDLTEWIYCNPDGEEVRTKLEERKINWRDIPVIQDLEPKDLNFETLKDVVKNYVLW